MDTNPYDSRNEAARLAKQHQVNGEERSAEGGFFGARGNPQPAKGTSAPWDFDPAR